MQNHGVVGVRQLRSRLSAYLRAVARGATITIGDRRRRPVARLVPATPSADAEEVDRLVRRGVLQAAAGKPGRHARVKPLRGRPTVADIVIEDRR